MNALDGRIKGKVVLAGVGKPGRGDDAFGPLLVRRLSGIDGLSVLDCCDRLEDFTGDLARKEPDTVLIADAVEMGATPGELALLEPEHLRFGAGDTHRASLRTAMEYLRCRTGATVLLLGIQPGRIADTWELSPQVASSIDCLEKIFRAGYWRVVPGKVTRGVCNDPPLAAEPSDAALESGSESDSCHSRMPNSISIPTPMTSTLPLSCSAISLAGEDHEC
jgi:hydrogenase 3 maturation protease